MCFMKKAHLTLTKILDMGIIMILHMRKLSHQELRNFAKVINFKTWNLTPMLLSTNNTAFSVLL